MCHVIVPSNIKFESPEEKKKFQETKRLEISKKIRNAMILFVYICNKNSKKVLERYQKRHPKAIHWPSY